MTAPSHRDGDFIDYPLNRVAGTVPDATRAHADVDDLLAAGFDEQDIDVVHGEEGLHRLDPSGKEHGFLARFQRSVLRLIAANEESRYLRQHVEDVRQGRFVVMVRAEPEEKGEAARAILASHGASFVGFYGRWTWQSLDLANDAPRGRQ